MSLDRSLKGSGALTKHRNVLTRPERIAALAGRGRFDMAAGDPLGLPKVANRRVLTGGKAARKAEAAAATAAAATAEAAAPADAAKAPAGGAKAPAGGAKTPAGR
jgi:small basic protein (TIGR04137 family)